MTDTKTDTDSARVRSEIDDTRDHLGQTVEAIGDRVMPGRIIERKKENATNSIRGLRERIMGTAHDARGQLAEAPESLAHRTEGSPLAAGGVAFAIGFLAAAVMRPTGPERQVAEKVADAAPELTADVAQMGREMADSVKEQASGAAEQIKASVTDAGDAMKTAATGNTDSGDMGGAVTATTDMGGTASI